MNMATMYRDGLDNYHAEEVYIGSLNGYERYFGKEYTDTKNCEESLAFLLK